MYIEHYIHPKGGPKRKKMFECRRCGKRFKGGSDITCFTLCEGCGKEVLENYTGYLEGLK